MNSWVIVRAGGGYDELFNGRIGYGMYKTTVEIKKGERVVFRELQGDTVDVYINGERVMSEECKYGMRFEYKSDTTCELDITVVIATLSELESGGISKAVIVSE